MAKAAPATATGPAGHLFEAKVAAGQMLAMLRGSEPRGLPGAVFERIKFQRAAEGHPLDDVIVDAHDARGQSVTLEIQAKRSITFAPKDPEFRDVMGQIAKAIKNPAFAEDRLEFAIVTNQTTRAITGPYQDVLSQVRKLETAEIFMARLARPGSANDEMRGFVNTVKVNLEAAGVPGDPETVWSVLRHLQIHVYDFDTPGSMQESYARDRAADLLSASDKQKASALWESIVAKAFELDAAGGATTREELRASLSGYRFEGDRQYAIIRAKIGETAHLALSDMPDRVQEVVLQRTDHLAAIREAAQTGRFVEVRGDAGVGKSGVLRHLAEEVGRESRIVVLSPKRIPERGSAGLLSHFQFDGTLRELLSDLACDGGGWVFIDNLDGYSQTERPTVVDVIRTAAEVAGIVVVATARPSLGDNLNWLKDPIKQLGAAKPVRIDELTDAEVEELRTSAPQLQALLANDHPARKVTRNLFRLARLAQAPAERQNTRSEMEMAEQWWVLADGEEDGRRERARLVREIAEKALKGQRVFNVSAHTPAAINALIRSETLNDHGSDKVSFRHDVLVEWAIANLLHEKREIVAEIPLANGATPALARAVELYVRFALEKDRSAAGWFDALNSLSGAGAHPTWRRAGLLALTHSELVEDLISVVGDMLLANHGTVLRELLPLILAIDVMPAREAFEKANGIDPSFIPETVMMPYGPVWPSLVNWLLGLGPKLPAVAMPETVDFLIGWLTVGLLIPDTLSTAILTRFETWLTQIEASDETEGWRTDRTVFGGGLNSAQVERLEEDLRTYLVLLAHRVPGKAKAYLTSVLKLKRIEDVAEKLLKFRGTLAQAAPEELAALTLKALVNPPHSGKEDRYERELDGAFTFVDYQFARVSPAQGPFFDLLTHAPAIGLKLVRDLIDRAIAFHTKGKPPKPFHGFEIEMPSGRRRFPWLTTYAWSRASHYSSITSGLMALETWAHARIEKGESVGDVIADIIGEPDTPAAYLLLVVDMLLSHWPASKEAAVPFVACPELLSYDLARPAQENVELPDFLGLKDLDKEPAGPKLDDLKKRFSRRASLDDLLWRYALLPGAEEERERATALLLDAQKRLGPPKPEDDRSEPRLMAVLAVNMLKPANYEEREIARADGSVVKGYQYIPPPDEVKHFAPFQKKVAEQQTDSQAALAVMALMNRPEGSGAGVAETLANWAKGPKAEDAEPVDQAVVGAAVIAMRDGTAELRAAERNWAEEVFAKAYEKGADIGALARPGLLYNLAAMAFAGRVFALKDTVPGRPDLERLLTMAAGDPAGARAGPAVVNRLLAIDQRLPRALLRVAFAASRFYWHPFDAPEAEKAQSAAAKDAIIKRQLDAELAWLLDGAAEPSWPQFPSEGVRVRRRRGIRIGTPPEEPIPDRKKSVVHANHQAAALWLAGLWRTEDGDWGDDVYRAYIDWTLAANGAGLGDDEESGQRPSEWNRAFFAVTASCVPVWSDADLEARLKPVLDLSDERFFDICTDFLRRLDVVYFNGSELESSAAVAVRDRFSDRLARSYGWRRLRGTQSQGVDTHLAPAASVLFFGDHYFGQPPKCYLNASAVPKSDPFISILQRLAGSAPSPFVAILVLNWLDVAPRIPQLPLLLAFALASVEVYPDNRQFWIDHAIGRRICAWLEKVREIEPSVFDARSNFRADIDRLLVRLVGIGVSEARRLETILPR